MIYNQCFHHIEANQLIYNSHSLLLPSSPTILLGGGGGYEFIVFFGDQKKKLLKTVLTCAFILGLLNSFHLPNHGSEPMNRYTLRLLLMCLEAERWGKVW